MRVSTIGEFRDHAARLMRDPDPLLVTRHGRLAGVFIPWTSETLPADWKRELFMALGADIARQLKESGVSEDEILKDFEDWRSKRRAARRGR